MKVLQINTTINVGSVGFITNHIGDRLLAMGHESNIAYGWGKPDSASSLTRIGNEVSIGWHVLYTRLTDRHGFASKAATRKFVNAMKEYNPDLVHLHNLHGYYLNIPLLVEYLTVAQKTVVWTFHDCWPFTGHCVHYVSAGCEKWMAECDTCPKKRDQRAHPRQRW